MAETILDDMDPGGPSVSISNRFITDWNASNLADAVRVGLLPHGDAPPAITASMVDRELFATPHTIWELQPAAVTKTNTVEFTFTPVAFGASLPNTIGIHRTVGTLPAAGVIPAALPAGILAVAYHTRLQRIYIWTATELIDRKQSWGLVIGTARHNLRYQDEPVRGGQNVFRYSFILDTGQDAPFATGTAVTMRLVAPTDLFDAPSARHWAHYIDVSDAIVFDATMAGAGTNADPRRVAHPFTAADRTELDSFRHEGRVEWSATITNGSSTPGEWGETDTQRGYGVAPPGDTDAAFGSITDNTIGTAVLYFLGQNSRNEVVMWIAGDQTWNENFLWVGDTQLHFATAQRLDVAATGGPESIYTWLNQPADLFAGAETDVSLSTPLTDDDYVDGSPTAELQYYGTARGATAPFAPGWQSLAVQELPALVTALPYHPAVGTTRRISGEISYTDTTEMTVGSATAGASLGEFDDQTIGGLTLQRVSIYAPDYTGTESAARAGKVFAVFQQVNNAIAGAKLLLDGTEHDITATYASAAADHEHEIPTLQPDALSPGTYRVQFIHGDDQSPANKTIGRAGEIVEVEYSARDQWVYTGSAPLNDIGVVPLAFLPIVQVTQSQYDALSAAGNLQADTLYVIIG